MQYSSFNTWYRKIKAGFFFTTNIHIITGIILYILLLRNWKEIHLYHRLHMIAHTSFFIASLAAILVSGQSFLHYAIIVLPAFVYPFAMVIDQLDRAYAKRKLVILYASVLIFLFLFSSTLYSALANSYTTFLIHKPVRNTVELIKKYTTASDSITIFGNYSALYLLAERKSASKYIYQYPIVMIDKKIGEEYFDTILRSLPKVICLDKFYWKIALEKNKNSVLESNLKQLINTRYQLLDENESFILYLRKEPISF